jgi:hypothetical protein
MEKQSKPGSAKRQQIDELSAAGFGNQTDVIRTAIDRMYVQEMHYMNAKQYNAKLVGMIRKMNALKVEAGKVFDTLADEYADCDDDISEVGYAIGKLSEAIDALANRLPPAELEQVKDIVFVV